MDRSCSTECALDFICWTSAKKMADSADLYGQSPYTDGSAMVDNQKISQTTVGAMTKVVTGILTVHRRTASPMKKRSNDIWRSSGRSFMIVLTRHRL